MTHCFYLILVPEILCINLNWLLENNDPKGPSLIAARTAFWETLSEMHRKYSLYLQNLSCLRKDALNVASLCFSWAYIWFFLRLGYTSLLQSPNKKGREIQKPGILLSMVPVFTIICLVVTNQPCAAMRIFNLRQLQHPPISKYALFFYLFHWRQICVLNASVHVFYIALLFI